ncbi:MAG: hypothetical protein SGILL_002866 [Bacillariaceae sp.]
MVHHVQVDVRLLTYAFHDARVCYYIVPDFGRELIVQISASTDSDIASFSEHCADVATVLNTMKSIIPATEAYPTFVYGTLMSPQVVSTLLGRNLRDEEEKAILPARLYGHARHCVKDHVFPATIPSNKDDYVSGLLLPPTLSPTEISLLDYFEGDEYNRVTLPVQVAENSDKECDALSTTATTPATVDAQVYLWREDLVSQLDFQPWSHGDFASKHLEWYLQHTVRPCREEMERLGMTTQSN